MNEEKTNPEAGLRIMTYYNFTKNWRKLRPHLSDPDLQLVLRRDFGKFVRGRWDEEFLHNEFPRDYDTCDWRIGKGRGPLWWHYVAWNACHWLVNMSLHLAILVDPKRPWRIVTSDKHSTVWDGADTLFDFNFQAFGIPADECFAMATATDALPEELRPGEELKVGYPQHYTKKRQCYGSRNKRGYYWRRTD